jgi:hypothetical protein
MKYIIIFIISLTYLCSCQQNNNNKELSVFVGLTPISRNDYQIVLHVNDSLVYNQEIPFYQLERYILMSKVKKTDSIMKFRIQINERDTSFHYNVTDVDSLLLGLYYKTIEVDSLLIPVHERFVICNENDCDR